MLPATMAVRLSSVLNRELNRFSLAQLTRMVAMVRYVVKVVI